MQLENYASGQWIAGSGKQSDLIDAITGDHIGTTEAKTQVTRLKGQ
jgi:hypothetical protein